MTDKKTHPLEKLLEIEEGSTPTANPFDVPVGSILEDSILAPHDPDEIDEAKFYDHDTSLEDTLADAPVIEEFYDDIDKKVEGQYQEIYNYGLQAFSQQVQEASLVEGKYRARNLEVAAQYLRIALDSAKDSGNQKANKDKIKVLQKKVANGAGGKTTNNLFVGDRNDLLRAIADADKKDIKIINDDVDDV